MKRAAWLAAMSVVWGYAVLQWGGVVVLDRKILLLGLGVAGLGWWLANRGSVAAVPGAAGWCWWLLPAYAALQLVPLPRAVLGLVSPARAEVSKALDGLGAGERAAPLSLAPGTGMNQFLLFAGCAAVFYVTYQIAVESRKWRWAVMLPPVLVAVLEGVLGLVQAMGGREAAGTYVNRDHYAGLMEMALPFAVAYPVARWKATDTRREFPVRLAVVMCVGWGAAAVILMGVLASLSRTGVVASLFAVLVMGIVASWGSGWRSAGGVAVLAAALAGCFVFLPSDALIARFAASAQDMTAEGRTELWRESLALVRTFPVFGCGLGGYEQAFLRHKVSVPMVRDDYAHNDYLQYLIELGAAGFAIGVVLMGSIAARAWRASAGSGDPRDRWLGIGCIGAFAAIGLHSFVDFNLYIPANALLLAWISGVALATGTEATGVADWRRVGLGKTIDVKPEKARRRMFGRFGR
jgi:O-antigen ligase